MAKKDRINLGPEMPCGHRPYVRHHPDGSTTVGVGSLVPGAKTLMGDGILVRHEGGSSYEVLYEQKTSEEGRGKGPAKVTSDAYREGWDNIFGQNIVGEA